MTRNCSCEFFVARNPPVRFDHCPHGYDLAMSSHSLAIHLLHWALGSTTSLLVPKDTLHIEAAISSHGIHYPEKHKCSYEIALYWVDPLLPLAQKCLHWKAVIFLDFLIQLRDCLGPFFSPATLQWCLRFQYLDHCQSFGWSRPGKLLLPIQHLLF